MNDIKKPGVSMDDRYMQKLHENKIDLIRTPQLGSRLAEVIGFLADVEIPDQDNTEIRVKGLLVHFREPESEVWETHLVLGKKYAEISMASTEDLPFDFREAWMKIKCALQQNLNQDDLETLKDEIVF